MYNAISKIFHITKIADTAEPDTFGSGACPPTWDSLAQEWRWEENLGTCGMEISSSIITGEKYIVAEKTIEKRPKSVSVGGLDVLGVDGANTIVTFTLSCMYLAEVSVGSQNLTVNTAIASDTTTGFGSIEPAFSLSVYQLKGK